ncbi:MAG: hypothetical protein HZB56_13730 [Deltaproteobacteria bacterium]|nr:hypothetical protein [Deltaproteobacteria bacterium]
MRPTTCPTTRRVPRTAAALLCLLLASPALGARAGGERSLSPGELLDRFGISITRVGVVGGGGMVDLRFVVRDPQKARHLLEGGKAPGLLTGRGGRALEAPHHGAQRSVLLQKDAPCFVLYPNVRGAVRPGGQVSVTFGAVRAGPIAVR